MPIRRARLLLAAVLLLTLVPSAVLGHAELDTISPADKSSGPPPAQIVGTFVQNLDPAKSNFRIVNAGGTVVAEGGKVDPASPRRMTLALSPLPPGAYTIRWTSFSTEDSELAHGETTFTVVAATPSPSVAPSASASPSAEASEAASPSTSSPGPSASPTGGTGTPTTSTSDAIIPVIAALIVLGALAFWLLRNRSRRVG
ncbi:MAG TPA: copper resistance CopC family protein [Candidatus Limnocylindrales bacterium]|nr:copper resistance CopC family protein [Candidatus Limnocylindrales bacterium]